MKSIIHRRILEYFVTGIYDQNYLLCDYAIYEYKQGYYICLNDSVINISNYGKPSNFYIYEEYAYPVITQNHIQEYISFVPDDRDILDLQSKTSIYNIFKYPNYYYTFFYPNKGISIQIEIKKIIAILNVLSCFCETKDGFNLRLSEGHNYLMFYYKKEYLAALKCQ